MVNPLNITSRVMIIVEMEDSRIALSESISSSDYEIDTKHDTIKRIDTIQNRLNHSKLCFREILLKPKYTYKVVYDHIIQTYGSYTLNTSFINQNNVSIYNYLSSVRVLKRDIITSTTTTLRTTDSTSELKETTLRTTNSTSELKETTLRTTDLESESNETTLRTTNSIRETTTGYLETTSEVQEVSYK